MNRKSPSLLLKFIDVVRQTKIYLNNLVENITDDFWDLDEHRILSEMWSASTRFQILIKRSLKGYAWQVTSRLETLWPEVRSSMSKCVYKKATQEWDMDQPKIQAAHLLGKIHGISPGELRIGRPRSKRQTKARHSSGNSYAMRFTSTNPYRQCTNAEGG